MILGAGATCGLALLWGIFSTLLYAHREHNAVVAKWEKTIERLDANNQRLDANNQKLDAANQKLDAKPKK